MADHSATIRGKMLARLTSQFGEPLLRGDCCWWTLSRVGRKPIRISLFVDGHEDIAMGWMCDLHDPISSIQHFSATTDLGIETVAAQISALMDPLTAGQSETLAPDSPALQPITRRGGTD